MEQLKIYVNQQMDKKTGVAELITVPDHGKNEELSTGVENKIKKIAGLK